MKLRTLSAEKRIYLKRCPRCRGDIQAGIDQYGKYIHCLQCGFAADIERPNPFAAPLPEPAQRKEAV